MRPKTRDVRMRKVRGTYDVNAALRVYVTADGRFVVTRTSARRMSAPGQWTLKHAPSGAAMSLWSYAECVEQIRKFRSAPASEGERWVLMPMPEEVGGGQVVYDRASGRWWRRGEPITQRELALMSELQPIAAFQFDFADITPALLGARREQRADQAHERKHESPDATTEAALAASARARRRG